LTFEEDIWRKSVVLIVYCNSSDISCYILYYNRNLYSIIIFKQSSSYNFFNFFINIKNVKLFIFIRNCRTMEKKCYCHYYNEIRKVKHSEGCAVDRNVENVWLVEIYPFFAPSCAMLHLSDSTMVITSFILTECHVNFTDTQK